jgi:hypothetical protein
MAVFKRVLRSDRLRKVPPQFSWIDHRLVREGYFSRCSANALALYLALVTVGDSQGLSYYSDPALCRLLPLDAGMLGCARAELIAAQLIAYQRPLYQVLALPGSRAPASSRSTPGAPDAPGRPRTGGAADSPAAPTGPQSIEQILRQMMEPQP